MVVLPSGRERGGPELIAARMRRLHRLAHRAIRADPLRVRPGHASLATVTAAAMVSADVFAQGHGPAALERPAAMVKGADDA
ncbi:hypothetical protein [Streptomyces sp. NPDC093990]|uniref:hypothetical protein n=1 Tax=Streptomyces sp. NPDC093990 TaxID=3155306 RepID=UPI003432337D